MTLSDTCWKNLHEYFSTSYGYLAAQKSTWILFSKNAFENMCMDNMQRKSTQRCSKYSWAYSMTMKRSCAITFFFVWIIKLFAKLQLPISTLCMLVHVVLRLEFSVENKSFIPKESSIIPQFSIFCIIFCLLFNNSTLRLYSICIQKVCLHFKLIIEKLLKY